MILTYKIKHNVKLSDNYFTAAQNVAEYAISNRDKLSSKFVSQYDRRQLPITLGGLSDDYIPTVPSKWFQK